MQSKFEYLLNSNKKKIVGYNYRENLFQHFVSPYLFFNKKLQPMLNKLGEINLEVIYNIKYIKKLFGYTIRKNNDDFN